MAWRKPKKYVIYDQYHVFRKDWFYDIAEYSDWDSVVERYNFFKVFYPNSILGLKTYDHFLKWIDSYK